MSTLTELKRTQGLKNKDIAEAFQCGLGKAGMILQGRYIHTFTDQEIERLAGVLGVSFARCWLSMQESYEAFMQSPAPQERSDEIRARVQKDVLRQFKPAMIPLEEEQEPRSLTVDGALVAPLHITQGKEETHK